MTTPTPVIRLSSPADVLSVVPHLLGYEVTESLLLICLNGPGDGRAGVGGATLGMAARMDLPAPGDAAAAVDSLLPAVARADPDTAIVIAYADSLTDATVAVEVLSGTLTEVGVKVLHRLVVVAGQWLALDHPWGRWTPMPGPESSAALEFAVAVGSSPAASRSALAGRCAAGPRAASVGRECDRLTVVDDELGGAVTYRTTDEVTIAAGAAAWGRLLLSRPGPAQATDLTLALAATSLHADGVALRDALAEWLAPGMVPFDVLNGAAVAALREHLPLPWQPGTEPGSHGTEPVDVVGLKVQLVDRLIDVAGCLPDDHAVPVLTLLGHVAWLQGNGAVARIAIDRALAADPNYYWAVLIGRTMDEGMCPAV